MLKIEEYNEIFSPFVSYTSLHMLSFLPYFYNPSTYTNKKFAIRIPIKVFHLRFYELILGN